LALLGAYHILHVSRIRVNMEGDGIIPMFVHGVYKFSKILEATQKFYVPEE
jgi:hypothetical protein